MEYGLVLLVMPKAACRPLLKSLRSLDINVLSVSDCQQARALLRTRPAIELIITQVTLADGNWCDLFKYLVDRSIHAIAVVVSPQADERLWPEILWRGAYDLLVEPYKSDEVIRVVEGALRAAHASELARAAGMQLGSRKADNSRLEANARSVPQGIGAS